MQSLLKYIFKSQCNLDDLNTLIFSEIQTLGDELEKSYPELYTNVCKQLQITIKSDTLVQKTFLAVAEHMVKNQHTITWGKVVALYALAGNYKGLVCLPEYKFGKLSHAHHIYFTM